MLENEEMKQDGFGQYDELRDDSRMEQFAEEPVQEILSEKSKKIKDKFGTFFLFLVIIGVIGWCLWSGIRGLFFANTHSMEEVFTNTVKGDVYEGSITLASKEYCSLKHTINLIPAGTEHFYLMYSPEMDRAIAIRAPKGWDTGFSNDFINPISGQEKGIVRELDYKVKRELSGVVQALGEQGLQVEPKLYLDLTVDKLCYLQIFAGLSLAFCSIYFTLLVKREGKLTRKTAYSSPVILGITAILLITLGMLIYLINMV